MSDPKQEKPENTEASGQETPAETEAFEPQDFDAEAESSAADQPLDDGLIAALQAEISELKDQLLRARADVENIRRRAEKDKADGAAYGITSFARDMLSVSDNLRRALDAAPEDVDSSVKDLVTGVDLTERELLSTFERHGVKRVEPAVGERFDPNLHQAMFEVPTTDHPNGAVVQVVGAGYTIKDRLLRPAMVGVARNEAAAEHIDTEA